MEGEGGQEKKIRIPLLIEAFMFCLALLFDILQFFFDFIPGLVVIAWFISVLAFIIFFLWFKLCGVSYLDRNGATKVIIALASVVASLIPFINALPEITLGVLSLILITRAEDENINLLGIADKRRQRLSPGEQVAADAWAKQRTERDTQGRAARRVEESRERRNKNLEKKRTNRIEDFSSPTINEFRNKERQGSAANDNEPNEEQEYEEAA